MAGNKNIILQPRDRHLFEEAATMRLFDREQAMIVGGFGSITRANTRLHNLTDAGLLRRFFLGSGGGRKAVYSLSPKGAQFAGVPYRGPQRPQGALLVADNFVQHQLTVNDIYCALKYRPIPVPGVTFHRWLSFQKPIATGLPLIPDGYVEFTTPTRVDACFLEVDLGHEALRIWKAKAENYLRLALSGEYRERFRQDRFRTLVVANSLRRLHSIRCAVASVTEKIFWFASLESTGSQFFEPIWFRPEGATSKPFFETTP